MKVLVTGGAGFIGTNTSEHFLRKGHKVTVLDNFSRRGSLENAKWLSKNYKRRLKIIDADIRYNTIEIYKELQKSDAVIHLAGQVAVTTSVQKPREDFDINALGTLNILEGIRLSKNKPILIYASTNKVYGKMDTVPVEELETRYYYSELPDGIDESFPVSFHSPYGCSKGTADQYVTDYSRIYNIDTVVFRQSCIYGPRQFGIEDQGWVAWFLIAGATGRPITIFGDGKQVRDLLYVEDLVNAYEMAIDNMSSVSGEVFNIGGGKENTLSVWHEFKPHIENNLNKKIKVKVKEWRPGDQKVFVSDIKKAKKKFKWKPKVSLQNGIKELSGWITSNTHLF